MWRGTDAPPAARVLLAICCAGVAGAVAATGWAAPGHNQAHRSVPSHAAWARSKMIHARRERLVLDEGFAGAAGAPPDPARWVAQTGGNGWGNEELEYYTARTENVALDGAGHLAITARREPYEGPDGTRREFTSARIDSRGLVEMTYGRLEARIKLPAGTGLWPAFWALGGDIAAVGWPTCGEIDVMESLGSEPFVLFGSIHGPQQGGGGYSVTAPERSQISLAGAFHTYGVIWTPSEITFTFDGVPYSTRTRASLQPGQEWVFDKPFFLVLNLAVGGRWPGAPDAQTKFPATMLVDWVRAYSG